jgi:uncharacterized coiled-coil DUF342 family protein
MIKKFILNLSFVKKEINSIDKNIGELNNQLTIRSEENADLIIQIRNFKAASLELHQEQTELLNKIKAHKENINELQLRNQELIQEKNKLQNQPKEIIPVQSDNKDKQILNLKVKIQELENEIETQKQVTFSKNKLINQLQAN